MHNNHTNTLHRKKSIFTVVLSTIALLVAAGFGAVAHAQSAGCTIFVSTSGNDNNSGNTESSSWRTPEKAVQQAGPGDVVCFAPGTYTNTSGNQGALHIEEKNGTAGQPITFRSLDPNNRAVFSKGSTSAGGGVSVIFMQRSSYINIDNLEATNGQRAITGNGVHHINVTNSYFHHTGGEVVYFGKRAARIQPDAGNNPSSHHILIEGNVIAHSGQGGGFGEGIYIATSSQSFNDDTHDVTIRANTIHDIHHEAIDIKTGAYNIDILDNRIYNIDLNSQAAITVAIHGYSWRDSTYNILRNQITNVTRVGSEAAGIWVGHGNANISDNVIWDVDDWGIYIPNTFNRSGSNDVTLSRNLVCSSGRQSVEWGRTWSSVPSQPADISFDSSNETWDSTSGSQAASANDSRCTLTAAPATVGTPPGGGTTPLPGSGGSGSGGGSTAPGGVLDWRTLPNGTIVAGGPGASSGQGEQEAPDSTFTTTTGSLPVTSPVEVTCDGGTDDNELMCEFIRIVNFLSIGVGIVAAITVAITGVQYSAARGDPNKTAQAIQRLIQVGIGAVAYVFGWALLNWLIPGGAL